MSMPRLAVIHNKKGNWTKLKTLFVIVRAFKVELRQENPDTLTEMTNLAFPYHQLKQWKKAKDPGQEALRLKRQVLTRRNAPRHIDHHGESVAHIWGAEALVGSRAELSAATESESADP